MSKLEQDVRFLKGVGEKRAKTLAGLGITDVGSLISYFPRGYEDRSVCLPISQTMPGETVCVRGIVAFTPTLSRIRRGMELVKLRIVDDSGAIDITYFNQSYVRDRLIPGESYVFYGKIGGTLLRRTMANPEFEPEAKEGEKTGRILPRYRLTAGISSNMFRGYMRAAIDAAEGEFPELLPLSVLERWGLAQARYAYENIHFPADFGALELARRRLIFEELFVLVCALGKMRSEHSVRSGTIIPPADIGEFYASLPFSPTGAQRRAVEQALADMASGRAMNRLIQGDVGSGKTMAAAAAVWAVCRSGHQAAFMAPTEILAEQHLATLRGFLSPFGINVEKLSGSMTAAEKRKTKAALAAGEIDLIVGTHALISGDVEFSSLALVITDEQHRFGVGQRSALGGKGSTPHTLVMSATPIPRTLALMIYGDLDVSVIDELPPGRKKIDTFHVDESYRSRLNGFIEKQAAEGRQIFVVCPKVEEDEEENSLQLKSAVEHAEELKQVFPKLSVACIHGKMKAKEKDAVMAEVVAGKIDVLVSTTVIEVGVDVPNASLMIVENAERFGLSQLHQLRGRVGRGNHKSWCILVSDAKNEEARERLKAMCETNDGFKISERDLALRGPGDFFGSRQHGLPEMHIADLCGDVRVMQEAQTAAQELLKSDPELKSPENAALRKHIEKIFLLHGGSIN